MPINDKECHRDFFGHGANAKPVASSDDGIMPRRVAGKPWLPRRAAPQGSSTSACASHRVRRHGPARSWPGAPHRSQISDDCRAAAARSDLIASASSGCGRTVIFMIPSFSLTSTSSATPISANRSSEAWASGCQPGRIHKRAGRSIVPG
jgi:hypothetical protein